MEKINTISIKSAIITANNNIQRTVITLDLENGEKDFFNMHYKMKEKFGCEKRKYNIAKSIENKDTFYSIFYSTTTGPEKNYNKISSIITEEECYGYSYILLFLAMNFMKSIQWHSFVHI